jgi:hypothetical protein
MELNKILRENKFSAKKLFNVKSKELGLESSGKSEV